MCFSPAMPAQTLQWNNADIIIYLWDGCGSASYLDMFMDGKLFKVERNK